MATIDPRLADDMTIAPYTWEAERNGLTFACEYPPGDVPQASFADIGCKVRMRGEVPTFVNATDAPLRFRARSLREATCPMIEVDIAPGDALIWGHRRVYAVKAQVGFPNSMTAFETLLFGRETVAGEVAIAQVWPTGETNAFGTYAQAMAAL